MRVGAHGGGPLTAETAQQISATIASQSVLAVLVGILLTVIVGGFAIANLVAARSGTALDSLARYSWAILAGGGVWVIWSVVRSTTDINSFQLALR
jgi:hypothetical protein